MNIFEEILRKLLRNFQENYEEILQENYEEIWRKNEAMKNENLVYLKTNDENIKTLKIETTKKKINSKFWSKQIITNYKIIGKKIISKN